MSKPQRPEPPPAARVEIAVLAKQAGLKLSAQHFEQLCDAWAKVEKLRARIPRVRPRSDEPAHTYVAQRIPTDGD